VNVACFAGEERNTHRISVENFLAKQTLGDLVVVNRLILK
jgi:hypothetical protein